MFRVRKLLESLGVPPQDLITQNRKAYGWTKELTTITDTDRFEDLCLRSEATDINSEECLSLCL